MFLLQNNGNRSYGMFYLWKRIGKEKIEGDKS
jgi:hypothetical protein